MNNNDNDPMDPGSQGSDHPQFLNDLLNSISQRLSENTPGQSPSSTSASPNPQTSNRDGGSVPSPSSSRNAEDIDIAQVFSSFPRAPGSSRPGRRQPPVDQADITSTTHHIHTINVNAPHFPNSLFDRLFDNRHRESSASESSRSSQSNPQGDGGTSSASSRNAEDVNMAPQVNPGASASSPGHSSRPQSEPMSSPADPANLSADTRRTLNTGLQALASPQFFNGLFNNISQRLSDNRPRESSTSEPSRPSPSNPQADGGTSSSSSRNAEDVNMAPQVNPGASASSPGHSSGPQRQPMSSPADTANRSRPQPQPMTSPADPANPSTATRNLNHSLNAGLQVLASPQFLNGLLNNISQRLSETRARPEPSRRPSTNNSQADGVTSSPSSHNAEDVNMAPQANPAASTSSSEHPDGYSMPDLQPISDEDDSSMDDADEVETMPELQPIDSDSDTSSLMMPELLPINLDNGPFRVRNTTPAPERSTPNSGPPRTNRRARVEDDEDEDRDRRHPSQRAAIPADPNHNQPRPPPPIPHHFHIPAFVHIVTGPGIQATPDAVRVIQHIVARGPAQGQNPNPTLNPTQQNNNNNDNSNNNNRQQNRRGVPIFAGGFTVTLGTGPPPGDANGNMTGAAAQTPANAPPVGFELRNPGMGGAVRADMLDMATFADIMGRFGAGLGQILGLDGEKEQEDVERAKKLVSGLEEVPEGLVKRLERVGGAPGGHVDGSQGGQVTDAPPGCAICWDTLLDAESDGFAVKETTDDENPTTSEETAASSTDDPSAVQPSEPSESTTPGEPSSAAEATASSPATEPIPTARIVSLPCTHVFHASCLIPWFSRPRQTTCPTCRFNIDPDNLTYVRRRPAPQTPGQAGPTTDGTGVIVLNPDGTQAMANPEATAPPTAAETDPNLASGNAVPLVNPTDAADGEAAPAPMPEANANGAVEGFWTFGFDMVLEQPLMNGGPENNDRPETQGEDVEDVEMADGDNDREGERRDAQEFAQQFLDGIGITVANRPDAPFAGGERDGGVDEETQFAQFFGVGGNNEPPTTTPAAATTAATAADNSARPPHPMAGFGQMMAGAMNGHHGPVVIPPWMVGANVPRMAPMPPRPPPPPPFVANGRPPIGNWGDFAQLFGLRSEDGGEHFLANMNVYDVLIQRHVGIPPPPEDFAILEGVPLAASGPRHMRRGPPREKRPWTLPPPPGLTLRQRVEQKEREVGLRCCDVSCGVGPSDEEPNSSDASMKQLSIRPLRSGGDACAHTFHPACLVRAERVAFGSKENVDGGDVGVSCSVCRMVGCVTSEEWMEGEKALD